MRQIDIGSEHVKEMYIGSQKVKSLYLGSTRIFPYLEITNVVCNGDVPACGGTDYKSYITVTYTYNGIVRQKSATYTHTWASLGTTETTSRTKLATLTVYINNDEEISFSSGSISGSVDIYQAINKKDDYCDDPVYGTLTATSEIIAGAITSDKMAKASGGYVSLQLKAVQSKTIQWYYTSGAVGSKTETTASVKWSGDGSQYLASNLGTTLTTATLVKTMQNTATSEHGDVASTSCEIWQEANRVVSTSTSTTSVSLSLSKTSFDNNSGSTSATLIRYYDIISTYTSGKSKTTGSSYNTVSNPYNYLSSDNTGVAYIESTKITVTANSTSSTRTATITATYDGKTSSVGISQTGVSVSYNVTYHPYPSSGQPTGGWITIDQTGTPSGTKTVYYSGTYTDSTGSHTITRTSTTFSSSITSREIVGSSSSPVSGLLGAGSITLEY